MKKIYVTCRYWTAENGNTFKYFALICDLGYRKIVLSKDKNAIAELLGIPIVELYQMKDDEARECGVID